MQDKQYFTVKDIDAAHSAGVAFGLSSATSGTVQRWGASASSSRVEEALALLRRNRGGTKVESNKMDNATKLLLGLGLSGAAIAAATSSKSQPSKDELTAVTKDGATATPAIVTGKAGTELPLGLTLDKDGKAAPAIDGKVSTMLGMVGKVAAGVNPILGAILGLGTSFLSKDLTSKAAEFNKAEDAKFAKLLGEKDKDFTDYPTLAALGLESEFSGVGTDSLGLYSAAKDSSAANDSSSGNGNN